MFGTFRNAMLSVACCLLLVSTCSAAKKRIRLKDGRVIVGDVVGRTEKVLKVKLKIAEVSYPLDQVVSIEDISDPKTEYAGRLAKLDKKSADANVDLAQWAMENKMYKEAIERLEAALAIDADSLRAKLLLRQAKAKLASSSGTSTSTGGSNTGASTGGTAGRPVDPKRLVKSEDIYRIRLAEIGEKERATVQFRKKALTKFIAKMQGTGDFAEKGFEATFRRYTPLKKAAYMLETLEPDDPLRDDILVKTDPAFMKVFRTRVWRTVNASCAATRCHGARKGQGGLKLFNVVGVNEKINYTNFLILDSFSNKGGRMIDRDEFEKSLLLQYGLPPDQAEFKHKKKIRPVYGSRKSRSYAQVLAWIKSLKGPRHPDYGIKQLPLGVMKRAPDLPFGATRPKTPTTAPAKKKGDIPF